MWNECAGLAVSIDSTFNMSRHRLRLVTIILLSQKEQGFPVATMLTNREALPTVACFFKAIRRVVKNVNYTFLMSDDSQVYHKAFTRVFGKVNHILCTFHLYQAWRKYARKMVDSKVNGTREARNRIVRKLLLATKELQHASNQQQESSAMDALAQVARVHRLQRYVVYIRRTYMTRKRKWMSRFRPSTPTTTNNFCEAFHANLKRKLLVQARPCSRVDNCVVDLCKVVDNSVAEVFNDDGTLSYRQKMIGKRHRECVRFMTPLFVMREGARFWIVTNHRRAFETFGVRQVKDTPCCRMVCRKCSACKHMFECDCTMFPNGPDAFCVHVHAVCMFSINNSDQWRSTAGNGNALGSGDNSSPF